MAIIVTGGSKGIGREVVLAFAEPDKTIVVNYHSDDASAEKTAAEARARGANVVLCKADAGTVAGCNAIADAVRGAGERAEMTVHCALDVYASNCINADPERFAKALTTNSASLLFLVQALDDLLDRGSTLFFFSSRGASSVAR